MFELIDGWFLRALNDTSNPFLKNFVAARADREGLRHVKIKRDCPRFFSLSTVILKNRVWGGRLGILFETVLVSALSKNFDISMSICRGFSKTKKYQTLGFPDFGLLRP